MSYNFPVAICASIVLTIFVTQSHAQTKCGVVPLSQPCHAAPICTNDGWVSGKLLQAGSGCTAPGGLSGVCTAAGACNAIKTARGFIHPDYYLVTVVYAPPGNRSKASYAAGSTAGTSTSVGNLLGSGIKVGISGNVIADASYSVSAQNSQSFQVSKAVTTPLGNTSVADSINHGQDVFYVWVNPSMNYSQEQLPGSPVNITLAVNGSQMLVLPFTLDELMNPSSIPTWKTSESHLTAKDFAQVAAADPFSQASFSLPPDGNARFVFLGTLQLDGPDQKGDDPTDEGYTLTDSQQACVTNTFTQTMSVDAGFSVGADFFGQGEKASVVASLTYNNSNSSGDCNGASQAATVDLSSSTVGFHDVISVYEDTVYHSFVFVSATGGNGVQPSAANITGGVKDIGGHAVSHELVVARFSNGHTQQLYTDKQGNYSIFGAPGGVVTLTTGKRITNVSVTANTKVVQSLIVEH